MKSRLSISIVSAVLIAAAAPAFASSCPVHMKEIDAYIQAHPDIDKKMLGKAKGLRSKGEAMHKAGKHDESVKALMEAKKALGMQ